MYGGPKIPAATPAEVEAARAVDGQVHLVDVREPDEYCSVRATFGESFPLSRIQAGALPDLPKSERIYVVCLSGGRSEAASKVLLAAGFTDVVNVTGGMRAWEAAGLDVNRG